MPAATFQPDREPALGAEQRTSYLTPEAAAATGLPPGLPVIVGGADNACGAVGAGVVQPGQGLVSVGSSGVVLVQSDRFRTDPGGRIHSFSHAVPQAWYLMGVMLAAGLSYTWLRDEVTRLEAAATRTAGNGISVYELLDAQAATPLSGAGQRVRSGGRSLPTFSGLRSRFRRQTKARPTEYGAALLAAVGAGVFGSVREAAEACVRVQSVVEPDPDHARRYDEAYAVYRQLYPALRPVFPAIARLAAQCKGQ